MKIHNRPENTHLLDETQHSQNTENKGMNYFTLRKEQLIKILGDKEVIISDPKWDNITKDKA